MPTESKKTKMLLTPERAKEKAEEARKQQVRRKKAEKARKRPFRMEFETLFLPDSRKVHPPHLRAVREHLEKEAAKMLDSQGYKVDEIESRGRYAYEWDA